MSLFHPRSLRASILALFSALLLLLAVACSAPPTLVAPTPRIVAVVITATPSDTPTEQPTETPRPTETPTATPTLTPTSTPSPTLKSPPKPPSGGAVGSDVRFMGQLIAYFSKLGPYPPEPPIARPPNVDPLTGLVVDPVLLQRRPILARLGNDPQARPHAGLNQADLVFEEMIDQQHGFFSVTRLTAVFLGQDATVRPFRSARQVNASLQPMLNGALAHSGAGKGVRFLFSNLPWGTPLTKSLNLDDLWFGSSYCLIGNYWVTRVASTTEHIHETLKAKGLDQAAPLRGFDFSSTAPGGAPASSVALDHQPWPITTSSVQWKYDPGSGRYLRFSLGAPHNTQQYPLNGNWGGDCTPGAVTSTEQVSAANVVVLNAEYEPTDARDFTEDSLGSTSVFIELTGSGTARIYRDGVQIVGTWQRPTLQHFFRFVDAGGNVIPLKPGNTWFEITSLGYTPTVK
ncbi:MAG: DUF3048 domain-containing protein [Anaerolineae bacterium]